MNVSVSEPNYYVRVVYLCDSFADVTPEDYVIEEITRRILQEDQRRPYGNVRTIPDINPEPEFTYRFPERSSNSEKSSQFAVDPSEPKYYENVNSLTGE